MLNLLMLKTEVHRHTMVFIFKIAYNERQHETVAL